MAVKKNRRYLIINIVAVTLVLLVTAFLAFYFINTDHTVAAGENQIEIKIDKVTTVSVYAFGPGVEFVESTSSYDIYTAEIGTTVRLQAVNETRIFTDWVVTKLDENDTKEAPEIDVEDLENSILNIDVTVDTPDLKVTVNRRNAVAEEYGKYMLDRFVIADEADLIALQNILAGSNDDDDFAKYYESPTSYDTQAEKDKIRVDLQYGYFLIANNFTVFNENFIGIGTKELPFQGIMCGKNGNINSKLFITITAEEQTGESSYGLFRYLGNKAVIRNLIVSTSIGIDASEEISATNSVIYAGGLAGVMNKSTLIDVEVSASIGVDSKNADEIYAGGLAGSLTEGTGIDSISDVVYEGTKSKWSLVSHKEGSIISAGFVAGTAIDAYIKEVDLVITDQIVDLKNDAVTGKETNSKLYLGNVFGTYTARSHVKTIDDIMIMGNEVESLRAMTTNGEAMVGGLIGYVSANQENGKLNIEKVYFRALGDQGAKNEYSASTISTTDIANVYAGGIIGYVEGNKVIGLDGFKNRFQNVTVDENNKIVANYLFEGEYEVLAVQNGTSNATTNGKAIAGGIIGKGYMNLSGEDNNNRSKLALVSPTSSLIVEAIQSKLTGKYGNINDKEHAAAALIYGSVGNNSITANYINVYTNNTTVQTVREIGSKAVGDLHTGGFISYATGSSFSNIGLYFNDSSILAESLSYEAQNTNVDTNSAFCGGFAGELLGKSSLTNVEFAGYDTELLSVTGTTSHLESIQNTIPGGKDYMGENYIGGIVGRIQYASLEYCNFIGSTGNKDYIKMTGHESPDSAFCGGIVGMIRTDSATAPATIANCEVSNTEVTGNATNTNTSYSNPDIYIGGIVGAAYLHNTNSTITIKNCSLIKTDVYALGNELMATYAAGIIAGATWEDSLSISDCYVTDSSIKSTTATTVSSTNQLESSAAGIVALKGNNTVVEVAHCVVIDTEIDAKVNSNHTNISAYASGIAGFTENNNTVTLINCYSNALVTANHQNASGTANIYGLAYNGTLETATKEVTVTTDKVAYETFTITNKDTGNVSYTFEVVSQENGTYRIKNSSGTYIRIDWWGNISTNNSANRATTFTYNNGHLVYNNSYIGFDSNGGITYSSNANSAFNFTDSIETTITKETGTKNVTYNNSYYLKKNAKNAVDTIGTAIGTGPFNVKLDTATNLYSNYDYLYGYDGFGQNLYIEIIEENSSFKVSHQKDAVDTVMSTLDNQTALAHVWINAKETDGDTTNWYIPDHDNKEEAAEYGWFILDYVLLYTGDLTEITSDLSNIDTSYTDGKLTYEYKYDNELHYLENVNDNSDIIKNNYIEHVQAANSKVKEFTFKVYDEMLALNVDFEITHFGANYKMLFADKDGNIIDDSDFKRLYGNIELELITKHSSVGNDKYKLIYTPNEEIKEDVEFYIRFIGGNNAISAQTTFKINLKANKLQLVGVTYADYTPPLNYYIDDGTLGTTVETAYQLYVNSTTRFIPIFTKLNDLEQGKEYALEEYIVECNYTIDDSTDAYFDLEKSGDFKVGTTSGKNGQIQISYGGITKTVFVMSVVDIEADYSVVGADITTGLRHATNTTNFYFEQYIRSNYSGIPSSSVIKIDEVEYDLTTNPAAYNKVTIDNQEVDGIKVYAISKERIITIDPITSYSADAIGYIIEVNKSLLTNASEVYIKVTYPIVYTISFELQCENFNPDYTGGLTKTYKVVSGTTYKDFFNQISEENPSLTNKEEILQWVEEAKIFGYVFTGFYLVSDANSIHSYGVSFDDLSISTYAINSSNNFYGRWSYLIELIEAPGTYIKTGFNSAFLQNYVLENGSTIQIPINTNQGYLFRVDVDSTYQGRPEVEACVVSETIDSEGNIIKITNYIPVEIYPENENLYYIRPEYITGYLVVMTTVSNSDVIVGENTSSVVEDITTEDGIITFKYIVNHYNIDGKKSYIYNIDGYENLTKEFVLDFYKQSNHSDLTIPNLTGIRVYYNRYVDGSTIPNESIVGSYVTYNDDRVYLTEFVQLDLETPAFDSNTKFVDVLEGTKTVTEVYYFTITPPNGYSENVLHEMANYVIECGYCDGKVDTGEEINYLEGNRTTTAMINNAELGSVVNNKESAKQEKEFHIVPTRQTTLVEEANGTYTFTDDKTYSIYDITLTDTQKLPDFNYISLYDDDRQSILESSIMSFPIKELRLNLGYRLGKVRVYGKTNEENAEWIEIGVVDVTSAVYQEYVMSFKDEDSDSYPYYAYKLDNISTNEIRLSQVDVTSAINGVVYEGPAASFEEKSVVDNKYTYSLVHQIVGDSRHDGKKFVLAVQFASSTDTTDIIEDLFNDVYIKVNGIGLDINHYVYLNEYRGKNTAYINLSSILEVLNVKSMNFTINYSSELQIHEVQLLEVTNEYKPLSGEVRIDYKQIEIPETEDTTIDNPVLKTIDIAVYDNTGMAIGEDSTGTYKYINRNYICDTDIVTKKYHYLSWQNKILLNKISDNVYKIMAVGNNTKEAASSYGVTWTHAIATPYSADYISNYGSYVGYYMIIEEDLTQMYGYVDRNSYNRDKWRSIYNTIKSSSYIGIQGKIVKYSTTETSTIHYDLNGGEWGSTTPSGHWNGDIYETTLIKGSPVSLPTPKRVGYKFLGWYDVGQKVTALNARNCTLMARWQEAKIIVDTSDPDAYQTLAAAIADANDGDTIVISAGTYSGNTTINKSVTILGANAGIDPNNTLSRSSETTFTGELIITTNDVTIDGVKLTGAGHIYSKTTSGVNNITIQNVLIDTSTVNGDASNDSSLNNVAPISFGYKTTSNSVDTLYGTYENITIRNVRNINSKGRAMAFYGTTIHNLTIEDSYFEASSTGVNAYNDGIKIEKISGEVNIVGNTFIRYHQYTIWFLKYAEGTYDISNNSFESCGHGDTIGTGDSSAGTVTGTTYVSNITFNTYYGNANGLVNVICNHNSVTSSYSLIRFNKNSDRTATTQIVNVNYNKFISLLGSYYIDNRNSYSIDATNNWYNGGSVSTKFKNATWSPYIENEADIPSYNPDE